MERMRDSLLNSNEQTRLSVLEICAGGGGQAIGLELAGFGLSGAIEIDHHACDSLRRNRPHWNVINGSISDVSGKKFSGIDLIAGGVPCPPFSIAGKQLGHRDERDLFPEALRLVSEASPAAVMLENVPGFASARFQYYRRGLVRKLTQLGYESQWRVVNASWFGVAQLRPRFVLVAFKGAFPDTFKWPGPKGIAPPAVGEVIGDLMASRGWRGAKVWRRQAKGIAPTIVGGSKKHGGPDLGPTRARRQWAALAVDGLGIADEPPGPELPVTFVPRLTVRMVARLQGFPDSWVFAGGKTAAYRQVGNAFPPPVAFAVGEAVHTVLVGSVQSNQKSPLSLFAAAI